MDSLLESILVPFGGHLGFIFEAFGRHVGHLLASFFDVVFRRSLEIDEDSQEEVKERSRKR